MSKGLEALKETAIQIVEALYGKEEPLRNNKINELLETKQFKCIEKELKALEVIKKKIKIKMYFQTYDDTFMIYLIDRRNENEHSLGIEFENEEQEEYDLLKEKLL